MNKPEKRNAVEGNQPTKTTEELNALKEECEDMGKKLAELSEEELKQVTGGMFGLII